MSMRRLLTLLALAPLLLAGALRAQPSPAVLGASGEIYQVQRGPYRSLFPNAPAAAASNIVLALDVVTNGKLQRTLVPGTDGPEVEQWPSIAVDRNSGTVYLVWEEEFNYHSVLSLLAYSGGSFGDSYEFAGDAFSFKSNPVLATTVDSYQALDANGNPVATTRTILHLVWFDDGAVGQRVLYTPLVIEDGAVLRTNVIFDLQQLAGDGPATGLAAPAAYFSLLQAPQVRTGRDGQSVVAGFVEPTTGALATIELRSVTGDLVSFADQARAQVIETGVANPGASRLTIANLARAQVIETGRKLLRAETADYLTTTFLNDFVAAADAATEDAAAKARAQVIETGVALHRGIADKSLMQVVEITSSDDTSMTHLLDVRPASRNPVPPLVTSGVRLYVSAKGDDAAVAWQVNGAVVYQETTDPGWSPLRSIELTPGLAVEDAFRLVEQRTAAR